MTKAISHRVCVCGDPGIGKSSYALYVFMTLVSKGENVIKFSIGGSALVFNRESGKIRFYCNGSDVKRESWAHENVWLLIDGHASSNPYGDKRNRAIVFASPKRSNYHEFIKDRGVMMYMPPWEWNEIESLIEVLPEDETREFVNAWSQFNDETVADIRQYLITECKRRFELVGGKIRLVLNDVLSYEKLESMLRSAIMRTPSDSLTFITDINEAGEAPSMAYSLHPSEGIYCSTV